MAEIDNRLPYTPGWSDRVTGWVRRAALPAWTVYLGLFVVLLLAALIVLWTNGLTAQGTLLVYFALSAFSPVYFLALIHYLDDLAAAALARFRPVMTVDDAVYERLRYQLTTLPAPQALAASLLGVIYAAASLLLAPSSATNPGGFPPAALGLANVFRVLVSWMAALTAYHTIHQLRVVSLIYTKHTRINYYHLGPLYALSTLTARTATGIMIPTTLWFWLNASASSRLALPDVLPTVLFSLIALATFVWPLVGAHRTLEREKMHLLEGVTGRIEATLSALHALIDAGQITDARSSLKDTLDGLLLEQGMIARLPTWPWRAETVRGVGAAFLLPILLFIIQRLLTRLGI